MSLILFPSDSFFRFPPSPDRCLSHLPPTHPFQPPPQPDIYSKNIPPNLTNMEVMDKDQAGYTEHTFDLDYDVAQALCSHIVPKVIILFMGEAPDESKDFEPEDGEGDDNYNKGGNGKGGGGTGLTFPVSAKTSAE